MGTARAILVLCRISNLPTVFANCLAAWFLSGGTWSLALVGAIGAGSLCYLGGMILNDVFDVRWDRQHGKPRPIAQGAISLATAGRLGFASLGMGFAGFLFLDANPWWAIALLVSILLYEVLHKRWSGSIWLMGACRFFLFITVASISAQHLPLPVWLWGMALTVYVAGVTLAARNEDTGGGVSPLAPLLLFLPAVFALGLLIADPSRPWIQGASLLLFLFWIFSVYRRLRRGKIPLGGFVGLLLAGMVLIDSMALSPIQPLPVLCCLLLLPLNLLLQRFVPAT